MTIPTLTFTDDEKKENLILCGMVRKLASLLSYKPDKIDEMVSYTSLLLDVQFEIGINDSMNEDSRFDIVKSKTDLGLKLISRYELERKQVEILRHVLDNSNNDDFIKRMRESINDDMSQIILICEIYISMRSVRDYKKAYNHKNTMATMEKSFKVFFDSLVFDRFSKFDTDFEAIYDEE